MAGCASILGARIEPCVEIFEHVLPEDSSDGDEVFTFVLPTDEASPDKMGFFMFDVQVPVTHDVRVRIDVSKGPWIPVGLRAFIPAKHIRIAQIVSGRGDGLFWKDAAVDMAFFASEETCPNGSPWIPFDIGIITSGKPAEFFLQALGESDGVRCCTLLVVGQLTDPRGCRFTADGPVYASDGTLKSEIPSGEIQNSPIDPTAGAEANSDHAEPMHD